MKRLGSTAVVLVLAAVIAGCGATGITEEELREAKRQSFADGRDAGYVKGLGVGRRETHGEIADAREAAFQRGVDYVLDDNHVEPGQDYAIAFKLGQRGFHVRDFLPMKPGMTYECPPQSPYCTVADSGTAVPAATSEPAPQDPCDPSYPNVCLDPSASDYDCASSGEDGPDFVEGPVRILGDDPYDLDGSPRDGIGCDSG